MENRAIPAVDVDLRTLVALSLQKQHVDTSPRTSGKVILFKAVDTSADEEEAMRVALEEAGLYSGARIRAQIDTKERFRSEANYHKRFNELSAVTIEEIREHNHNVRAEYLLSVLDVEGRAQRVAQGAASAQEQLQKAAQALDAVGPTIEITSKTDLLMQRLDRLYESQEKFQHEMQARMTKLESKGCCAIQ